MIRYRIEGARVASRADFYAEIGRAVNGPGGYFGSNLDALADCLRGGFGTPDDEDVEFEWADSDTSRNALGSEFDRIASVFTDLGVPLRLR